MAKPVANPVAFAPLSPPWSLVSLDANFTSLQSAFNDYSTYSNYLADSSGVANAITVTTPGGTAFAYTAGIQIQVKVAVTNTSGTVNINVNGLGNQLVKNPNGSNPAVGQLASGGVYIFQFDGTNFQAIGSTFGITGLANPSAVVGLAAVNGTATTAMRSDSAPALDQSIAPTWSAAHTFQQIVTGAGFAATGTTVPTNGIYLPSANTLGFASATTARGSVNSTGNWNIAAPGSGVALTVNCLENTGVVLQGGTPTSGFRVTFVDSSATRGLVGYGASTVTGGALTDFGFTSIGAAFISVNGGASKQFNIATTGKVTVAAPTSGRSTFSAASGDYALEMLGNAGAGVSFGLLTTAGTNSSDIAFQVQSAASVSYFQVRGDGVLLGRGATAAALVDMTPDKSTFTGTLTGMTAGTTGTVTWVRMGNIVLVYIAAAISGTSNVNTMTMTGLPAAIQPANTQIGQCPVTDGASGTIVGTFSITGGTITFGRATLNVSVIMYAQAFQNSGAKGLPAGWQICYSLV